MKKIILGLSLMALLVVTTMPTVVSAQDEGPWNEWMGNTIVNTPVKPNADLIGIIFKAIQYLLAFLGVVAVVVILIGGFMWMTAGGNDEKVGKAKKILIQGLIGLIIILLAFAIATFVINRLNEFAA
jgi:hypothetical protein